MERFFNNKVGNNFKLFFLIATESSLVFLTIFLRFLLLVPPVFILINVSMVIGLIPVVGVPLPLVSQGGTSIVVHLLAFGVILSTKRVQT